MAEPLAVLKYYLYYKYKRPFMNREELEKWQKRMIKKHLGELSGRSGFYRGLAEHDILSLPIIDKAFMMEHFDEINTVGIGRDEALEFAVRAERERNFAPKLKGVTVGLSSGTSGKRGIFLISDQEKDRWAGYILAKFLPGSIFKTYSIAFFMRADSNLYEAVNSKNIQFHFFDIYLDMEEHRKRLTELQPDILAGQPSLLLMIAEDLRQGKTKIQPKVVISIAEVLEKEDEERLKRAFGLPVIHQVYQCTEGCLASTCPLGTLHLNEDIVRIEREYLDERRFIPVVTDFMRKAQPVIRYRLNDILVEKKETCQCKSPFLALERIEGREDDVFSFQGRDGKERLVFPDFIRRCILFADDSETENGTKRWVKQSASGDYRIVQETEGRISVYADLTEKGRQRVEKEFRQLSEDRGFALPEITFKPYFCEKGKKMKRIERKWK